MRYSMMSYTMSRQPGFNISGMLSLTAELKLAGVDFVTLYDRSAKDLRKMADDFGVPVICHTFYADLNAASPDARVKGLDDCKRGIEAAVELGAPVAMIPTPEKKGLDRHGSRRNWIEGLKEAVAFSTRAGISLTVENFPGVESPFVVANELLEAVREAPGLKITYDNGNAASGEDPAASFTASARHVVHAHFKDWTVSDSPRDGFRPMRDGRYYQPALVGEGVVDHRACLAAMRAAGYTGCINIEYEGNAYPAGDAVRKAVDYLRGLEAEMKG